VRLVGRTAWVTGASSGIGAALVRELAARGCRVGASARRRERLEQLARECGADVLAVPADVTDREAMLTAAAAVEERFGPIELAVLNAGLGGRLPAGSWDSALVRRQFDTNVMGTVYGIEAVLPAMRRRRSGAIVGLASVAGYRGLPRSEGYAATKAAQIHMLESLRIDLRPHGIEVVTVCPGWVRTELTATNSFPMPFILEADDAARRICRGIEKGKAEIVFPLPMMLGMKAVRLVPVRPYAWAVAEGLRLRQRD